MKSGYLIREGLRSLWQNKMMTLASVAVLSACLLLIGAAGLLSVNLNAAMQTIEDQNEVEIFILDCATEDQQTALATTIKNDATLQNYVYVSKQDALNEMKQKFGEDNPLLEGYEEDNPFPASYRVQLKDLATLKDTVAVYEALEGIEQINAPTDVADTLLSVSNLVTTVCFVFVAILVGVSLLIISNTIRLTVFNRRREINIMKYVGATNWFIRIPFLVEGMAIGLISALIAFGLVTWGYGAVVDMLAKTTSPFIATLSGGMVPYTNLWSIVLGGFIAGGVGTGAIGSLVSMQKHLEV
ncbi:MAG: permease-like cell division protein FtsX [Oscillospiraceae bacterium]|nr:permease-like cell division protein FtsX [Oscillospiraceae bacterium]